MTTTSTFEPPPPKLTEDEVDDLLYCARAGETSEFKETVTTLAKQYNRYDLEIVAAAVDEFSGNGCLHMAGGNGHLDICTYIISLPALTSSSSASSTTPSTQANNTGNTTTTPSTSTIESPNPSLEPTILSSTSTIIPPPSIYLTTLVNYPNKSLNTPLHWACLNGHLPIVKLLLEKGDADPGALNAAGHDAVYEAENADKSDVVDWVLGFGEMLEGVGVLNNNQTNGNNSGDGDDGDQEEGEAEEEKLTKLDVGEGSSKDQELLNVDEEVKARRVDETLMMTKDGEKKKKKNKEEDEKEENSITTKVDGSKEEEVYEKMSKMDIQTPSTLPDISTPQADVIR